MTCRSGCTCSESVRSCSISPSGNTHAAGSPRPLGDKLAHWDAHCDTALTWLLHFAEEHRDEILAVARARHITGHFVHGDGEMYEYPPGLLVKEVIEELADAVNYSLRRLTL